MGQGRQAGNVGSLLRYVGSRSSPLLAAAVGLLGLGVTVYFVLFMDWGEAQNPFSGVSIRDLVGKCIDLFFHFQAAWVVEPEI